MTEGVRHLFGPVCTSKLIENHELTSELLFLTRTTLRDKEMAKYLVSKGGDLNAKNKDGQTALVCFSHLPLIFR